MAAICEASVSYKKLQGNLRLTKKRNLEWQPNAADTPGFTVNGATIDSLFASKEGSAKVMLRVKLITKPGEPEQLLNFTFLSASSAVSDREHFKSGLSDVVAHYRQIKEQDGADEEQPALSDKAKGKRKAVSPPPDAAGQESRYDIQLRVKVLQANPDLKALHEALVITRQISEDEFWSTPGREALLATQYSADRQAAGRSAQMAKPQQEYGANNEIKVKITPQLISDLFAQYPIIQRAYNENVPPLQEAEFWQRFFSSKLYNQLRSSSRQSGDTIKDDDLLDKYLHIEEESNDPGEIDNIQIYRLLDLAATQEDHGETGNEQDYTMRAGSNRAAIPLMRRFNQHSVRMLDQALGKQSHTTTFAGDASQRNYNADILLDDLQPAQRNNRVVLNMDDDSQRYFEGPDIDKGDAKSLTAEQMEALSQQIQEDMRLWYPDLGSFTYDQDTIDNAFKSIISLTNKRKLAKASKSQTFPDRLLQQMTTCLATSNEFLRQFWTAILPPRFGDISYEAGASAKERALRAKKMAGYLGRTQERVDALVKGVDAATEQRLRFAMQPMLKAVAHAIHHFEQKTAA